MALLCLQRLIAISFILLNCLGVGYVQAANFQPSSWRTGHATFFGGADASCTHNGACGYGNTYQQGYGANTAALSPVLYYDGATCGACFELACDSSQSQYCLPGTSSIVVTAANFCEPGGDGWCDSPKEHFDLSQPAFTQLAQQVAGWIPLHHRRVPCMKNGGMRFTINGHQFYTIILVTNVAGAGNLKELHIKGSNTDWQPLTRYWGENWLVKDYSSTLVGQSLSIRAVASDGSIVTSMNVVPSHWQFSQTFEGSNF